MLTPLFCRACGKLYGALSALDSKACSQECLRELYWRETLLVLEMPYRVKEPEAALLRWLESEDDTTN